jgi:phosphoribosyl-AMP cyclohydrolase
MVQMEGRPLQFVQRIGNSVFAPMQSKDVPRYVSRRADYGITGEDLTADYNLGNGGTLKIVDKLGFGKADLVVFAKRGSLAEIKGDLKRRPIVAAPNFYWNLATGGKAGEYLSDAFGEFDVELVAGSTEGFVVRDDADLGFDLTTYFQRPPEERGKTTLSSNGLKIVERIMPTEAVIVAKNSPEFTVEGFEKILNGPYSLDWKKVGGLLPVAVQDTCTGELLMLAYANQNALQQTVGRGQATFWSRSRGELWTKGLTSGNTMDVTEILCDCDGDALLYRVKPSGPACHTGERSCFYRKPQEL